MVTDTSEKLKILYEQKQIAREKFEEEERKKRIEDEEDSKFDYLTLLSNTTKKHGNMRRINGGGVGVGFSKHAAGKKQAAINITKQFMIPGNNSSKNATSILAQDKANMGAFTTATANSNCINSNYLNLVAPTNHFKKRMSNA